MITDSYNWFVDIVADRRKLARADALRLADGRVFTGRQALDAKLIDEIGGEQEAIAWLGSAKGVDVKLPVRDWKPVRPGNGFLSADAIGLWIARQLGLGPLLLKGEVLDRVLPERLKLDGLMSVWQGPSGGDGASAGGAAR
jgi:protease-4